MRINRDELDFVLAEQCKNATDLCSIFSAATIARIRKGCEVGTKTAGKLALELHVPLERILEKKERNN